MYTFTICLCIYAVRPTELYFFLCVCRGWLERESRHGLQQGQNWFLISMLWWQQWKDYVKYVCTVKKENLYIYTDDANFLNKMLNVVDLTFLLFGRIKPFIISIKKKQISLAPVYGPTVKIAAREQQQTLLCSVSSKGLKPEDINELSAQLQCKTTPCLLIET